MKQFFLLPAVAMTLAFKSGTALAFCGFYVAKADTKLFNKASQVVLVRDDDKTVLTMANDFQGDPKEFAVVVPVPTFIERGQIHVAEKALIEHLDAYSAPRLVEYFDEDPCRPPVRLRALAMPEAAAPKDHAKALGVKIEAQYTVGEYDIVILSAEQSSGLETWLRDEGYKIPSGGAEVLSSYIKQNMRFFVAKVNLEEKAKLGTTWLRPIQIAYESAKFMLPIRLGMVNANGPQELFVYTLTRKGRVETTNYRTVKLPSGMDLPLFVKDDFADFYRAMFDQAVKKEEMRVVFTEYAWDMGWCDPCAADPLSNDELQKLGVFWLENNGPQPNARQARPMNQQVFVTRLHLRYDNSHFPEDLVFQETGDRENFQGRYVLRHPWQGAANCDAGRRYLEQLPARQEKEAAALAQLTGWTIDKIREQMKLPASGTPKSAEGKKWWQRLWNN
jgi:hypothetical protein